MELGCATRFSRNVVDVFVDGVACDRSMEKRVCDWRGAQCTNGSKF